MAAIPIDLEDQPAVSPGKLPDAEETLEQLVQRLAKEDAESGSPTPRFAVEVKLTHEEFMRNLRALADGPPLPSLPPDFCRADIYEDED